MFALRWVADRMHESRRPFRSSRVSRSLPRNEQIACQIACLARRVFWRVLGARSGFGAPRGPPRTVLKGELCVLGSSLADSTSPALRNYVSTELQKEAQTAKERRKAREERALAAGAITDAAGGDGGRGCRVRGRGRGRGGWGGRGGPQAPDPNA